MANTRKSTKRAKQAQVRQTRNQTIRSATRSALKGALDAVKSQDEGKAKEAYHAAIRAISKAASKGTIPKGRASRKISRLTHLVRKTVPSLMPQATSKK